MHRLKTVFYARFKSLLHWALGHHKAVLLLTLGGFHPVLAFIPSHQTGIFPIVHAK